MFSRVRQWNDLLPWIRLAKTLRLAGSPPLLLFVGTACLMHTLLASYGATYSLPRPAFASEISWAIADIPLFPTQLIRPIYPWWFQVVDGVKSDPWYETVLRISVSVLLWAPVALCLIRQGALLSIGRTLSPLASTLPLSIQRCPRSWIAAIVPSICVMILAAFAIPAAWLASQLPAWDWLQSGCGLIIAAIAIPCGVLGFGQFAAIPLGWAAMICEPQPDPLDSLSRGYEYLFRRPIQLLFYALVSIAVIVVAHLIALWVIEFGSSAVGAVVGLVVSTDSQDLPTFVEACFGLLRHFPLVVDITLAWGCVGGVYLLLRRDAGNQELEDIWLPTPKPIVPLPELPKDPS